MSAGAQEINISTQNTVTQAKTGMDLLKEVVVQNNNINKSMIEINEITGLLEASSKHPPLYLFLAEF